MTFPILRFLLFAFVCWWGAQVPISAQRSDDATAESSISPFILDSVQIITADVFDSTTRIPLVGGLVEQLHARTRERAIRNELFFEDGDTLQQIDLDELELSLRRLTIFSVIRFEVVPWKGEEEEELPYAMLVIQTRDAWSLRLSGSYSRSEDFFSGSLGLREVNLFGLGKQLGVSASYSSFNNQGWRLGTSYFNPNIFGTHVYLGGEAGFARTQSSGSFYVGRPFFSDRTRYAFNTAMVYYKGDDEFDFHLPDGDVLAMLTSTRRTAVGGWYSLSRGKAGDVFRASVSLNYNRTQHDLPNVHRALENSVSAFVGISSQRRRYTRFVDADFEGERQVAIGGSGSISIGKIAPHSGGLDNMVYVGGDVSQAVRSGNFYGFALVEGGTGLASGKQARFTTERVVASAAYLMNIGTLAARFEQSTVWNWPRYLFVPVDNNSGLRGHSRLQHFGDNRLLLNLEYRFLPLFRIMTFDFGAATFYDIGSAWRQSEQINKTQFHSSAGIGLRISNAKSNIDKGLLRVDLAYNFDEKRLARLIISSEEAFDVFGTLGYRPPAPYLY